MKKYKIYDYDLNDYAEILDLNNPFLWKIRCQGIHDKEKKYYTTNAHAIYSYILESEKIKNGKVEGGFITNPIEIRALSMQEIHNKCIELLKQGIGILNSD